MIQRRQAMPVASGHIGASAHEERRLVETAKAGGDVERRESNPVRASISAPPSRRTAQVRLVPEDRGEVQRRLPIPVSQPGVGASGKQVFGDGRVPPPMRRLEQERLPAEISQVGVRTLRERVEDPTRVVLMDRYHQFAFGGSQTASTSVARRCPSKSLFPARGMWTEISVTSRGQSISRVYTILGGLR